MRFSAHRAYSPSPSRRKTRNRTAFGIHSDSESEEEYESQLALSYSEHRDSLSSGEGSSSSEENDLVADVEKLSIRPRHIDRTPQEEREIEETVAAIRLRTRHHDPYEEWEKQTRKDAFTTARQQFNASQLSFLEEQRRRRESWEVQVQNQNIEYGKTVERNLEEFRITNEKKEQEMREVYQKRNRDLWASIERSIKIEQDRVTKKQEDERKAKENEERQRKEAESKKRLQEEKHQQEEEAKRKAEEEKRNAEAAAKQKAEAEASAKAEKERAEGESFGLRVAINLSTAEEDWRVARENLAKLKQGVIGHIKSNKAMKSEWGKLRRQITPKIGQLTNDPMAIRQISNQLVEILRPSTGPLPDTLYVAGCYSLAKAILLQAETEVTAEKKSAIPLAQVTFNLCEKLEHFPSIFFSKLVQRCGGWAVGYLVPDHDHTGKPWASPEEYRKACGYRKSASREGQESPEEYSNRVSGIMRVFFHIVKISPTTAPLYIMLRLPKVWIWFSRMLNDARLLGHPVAPQIIYTALDVLGVECRAVWGQQWIKILAITYEGVTKGYQPGKLIGGESPEGSAGRTRALLAVETIMSTP